MVKGNVKFLTTSTMASMPFGGQSVLDVSDMSTASVRESVAEAGVRHP